MTNNIALSIEARAAHLAEAMRAYPRMAKDQQDELLASLDMSMQLLRDEWRIFFNKHHLERKTP